MSTICPRRAASKRAPSWPRSRRIFKRSSGCLYHHIQHILRQVCPAPRPRPALAPACRRSSADTSLGASPCTRAIAAARAARTPWPQERLLLPASIASSVYSKASCDPAAGTASHCSDCSEGAGREQRRRA
jgi:hypothetical protein